jgi:hypothetical protein
MSDTRGFDHPAPGPGRHPGRTAEDRDLLLTALALGQLEGRERAEAEAMLVGPAAAEAAAHVRELRTLAATLRQSQGKEAAERSPALRRAVVAALARGGGGGGGPEPFAAPGNGRRGFRRWLLAAGGLAAALALAIVLRDGRFAAPVREVATRADLPELDAVSMNAAPAAVARDESPAGLRAPARAEAEQSPPVAADNRQATAKRAAPAASSSLADKAARKPAIESGPSDGFGTALQGQEALRRARAFAPAADDDVGRFLAAGRLPPPESVRVESLIDSFAPAVPPPGVGRPVAVTVESARCPWRPASSLMRVGLAVSATAATQALEVDVDFDPERVASFRRFGAESRNVSATDHVDRIRVGGVDPGRGCTALYEIEWRDDAAATQRAFVRVTPRQTGAAGDRGAGEGVECMDGREDFAAASPDLRFAAALAAFGLVLQSGGGGDDVNLDFVARTAAESLGSDVDGRRAAFVEQVRKAQAIAAARPGGG